MAEDLLNYFDRHAHEDQKRGRRVPADVHTFPLQPLRRNAGQLQQISPLLIVVQPTSTSETDIVQLYGTYDAIADGTLSVLWTIVRASAVGSVGLFGAVGEPARIEVIELGLTPVSSGTNI